MEELSIVLQKTKLFQVFISNLIEKKTKIVDHDFKDDKSHVLENINLFAKLHIDEKENDFTGMCIMEDEINRLIEIYSLYENYYLKTTISKTINENELDDTEFRSSCVDDVFYLIRKCGLKCIMTCDLNLFRNSMLTYNTGLQNLLIEIEIKSGNYQKTADNYFQILNDSLVCKSFTEKIKFELDSFIEKSLVKSLGNDLADQFSNCLTLIDDSIERFKLTHKNTLYELLDDIVKRKIETFVNDISKQSIYIIESEEEYLEYSSPIEKHFFTKLVNFITLFEKKLMGENFKIIIVEILRYLALKLEQMLHNHRYNKLGSMKLESEIEIIKKIYMRYSPNHKDFISSLIVISTLLNTEEVFLLCNL